MNDPITTSSGDANPDDRGRARPRRGERLWLPVPGYSVPVRVTLALRSELDPLSRAVWRLLGLRGYSLTELTELIGFDRDIVESVLAQLEDRRLIAPLDAYPGLYSATAGVDPQRLAADEVHNGWAYFWLTSEGIQKSPPQLWLGREPRPPLDEKAADFSQRHRECLRAHQDRLRVERREPDPDQLDTLLAALMDRPDLELLSPADGQVSREVMASSEWRMHSIVIDDHERSTRQHRYIYTPLWVPVSLLPTFSGSATRVFHAPMLTPDEDRLSPICDVTRDWILSADELEPLKQTIVDRAEELSIEISSVLRAARLDDSAQLRQHEAARVQEIRTSFGLEAPTKRRARDSEQVQRKLDEALRWSVLAERAPQRDDFKNSFADSTGHGVERLCQCLRDRSAEALRRWDEARWRGLENGEKKRFRKERSLANWFLDRMGDAGLHDALDVSRGHLLRLVKNLSGRDPFRDLDQQGAGDSLAYWLLPVLLLDADEAVAFARPITAALNQHHGLLRDLVSLVDYRNARFHSRREHAFKEVWRCFRLLYRCWVILECAEEACAGAP